MKARLIFIVLLVVHGYLAKAQVYEQRSNRYVVAYRTEIRTEKGQIKGVLEQVTDSNVVVKNDKNGYDYVPIAGIKDIRIKYSPNMVTYTVQDFYDDEQLVKTQEGFIDLNAPQNQRYLDVNPLEAILGNVFFNTAGILGTRTLNRLKKGMAGTITKFRVNGKTDKYARIKSDLQLYALQYQLSPAYEEYMRNALRFPENN